MRSVSLGMSASTSSGEKYRSVTGALLAVPRLVHEDAWTSLARDTAGEGQLDVGGPARSGDEVDHPAETVVVGVPGFQEHADLGQ
jgi:hypothetical protein